MVKRRKQEEISGMLEFAGLSDEDPTFKRWVAEHRDQNGGNLRMSKGRR